MATRECGLSQNGDYVAREQGVGVLSRIPRADAKDIHTATKIEPHDFEMSSGASAQSLMGHVVTAKSVYGECLDSSGAPVQATWSVNFGAGAVTITTAILRLQQATASITAITVTQSSGSAARIRAIVAGSA